MTRKAPSRHAGESPEGRGNALAGRLRRANVTASWPRGHGRPAAPALCCIAKYLRDGVRTCVDTAGGRPHMRLMPAVLPVTAVPSPDGREPPACGVGSESCAAGEEKDSGMLTGQGGLTIYILSCGGAHAPPAGCPSKSRDVPGVAGEPLAAVREHRSAGTAKRRPFFDNLGK